MRETYQILLTSNCDASLHKLILTFLICLFQYNVLISQGNQKYQNMSDLYKNKYRIPSARAQWHNYNGGCYFVTICTNNREHYFGEIKDNNMVTSIIGYHATLCVKKINDKYDDVEIVSSVVMPNHIHLIIFIHNNKSISINNRDMDNRTDLNENMRNIAKRCGRLSYIVAEYKRYITKYALKYRITFAWQDRFHDRIIRNQEEYIAKINYIEQNVSNWKDDDLY